MVKYFHLRFGSDEQGIDNKGGVTLATRLVDGGLHVGVAVCSYKDNFNKSIGRKIAEGRLDAGDIQIVNNERIGAYINSIKFPYLNKGASMKVADTIKVEDLSLGMIKHILMSEIQF